MFSQDSLDSLQIISISGIHWQFLCTVLQCSFNINYSVVLTNSMLLTMTWFNRLTYLPVRFLQQSKIIVRAKTTTTQYHFHTLASQLYISISTMCVNPYLHFSYSLTQKILKFDLLPLKRDVNNIQVLWTTLVSCLVKLSNFKKLSQNPLKSFLLR